MPNTLAHIGIQTVLGKAVTPKAEIKWIWAACILPDLPWILQIAVRNLLPEIDRIDLRLFAIVQSSLFFILILAAALAVLSRSPSRTFAVLAFGAVLHLLLDASQTKWGNGILLFAPFDWQIWNFGLYWPEDLLTTALTAFGAVVALVMLVRYGPDAYRLRVPMPSRLIAATVLIAIWCVLPLAFVGQAEDANLHDTHTLREIAGRAGQPITVDRNNITHLPDGATLSHWTGEVWALQGDVPAAASKVSLKGTFIDAQTVQVTAIHLHRDGPREWFSYAGLLLILLWWAAGLLRRR